MFRKQHILYLSLVLFIVVGCNNATSKIETSSPTIQVTSANYSKIDSNFHYEIDLNYPVINGPISESILNHINNSLVEIFYQYVPEQSFIESHHELPEQYDTSSELFGVLQNSYGISQCDSIIHIWFSI
jgi:hypothetical protein